MADKNNPMGKRKKVTVPGLDLQPGAPASREISMEVMQALVSRKWDLNVSLTDERFARREQAETAARVNEFRRICLRDDISREEFIAKYGNKFKSEEDAGFFLDDMRMQPKRTVDMVSRAMRDFSQQSPDHLADLPPFASKCLEVFEIPQIYGMDSVVDMVRMVRSVQNASNGKLKNLDDVSRVPDYLRANPGIRNYNRCILTQAAARQYLGRNHTPENMTVWVGSALYGSDIWNQYGDTRHRMREFDEAASLGLYVGRMTSNDFVRTHRNHFHSVEDAAAFFRASVQSDKFQHYLYDFRQIDFRDKGAGDADLSDYKKFDECFHISSIYGYQSLDDVVELQTAAAKLTKSSNADVSLDGIAHANNLNGESLSFTPSSGKARSDELNQYRALQGVDLARQMQLSPSDEDLRTMHMLSGNFGALDAIPAAPEDAIHAFNMRNMTNAAPEPGQGFVDLHDMLAMAEEERVLSEQAALAEKDQTSEALEEDASRYGDNGFFQEVPESPVDYEMPPLPGEEADFEAMYGAPPPPPPEPGDEVDFEAMYGAPPPPPPEPGDEADFEAMYGAPPPPPPEFLEDYEVPPVPSQAPPVPSELPEDYEIPPLPGDENVPPVSNPVPPGPFELPEDYEIPPLPGDENVPPPPNPTPPGPSELPEDYEIPPLPGDENVPPVSNPVPPGLSEPSDGYEMPPLPGDADDPEKGGPRSSKYYRSFDDQDAPPPPEPPEPGDNDMLFSDLLLGEGDYEWYQQQDELNERAIEEYRSAAQGEPVQEPEASDAGDSETQQDEQAAQQESARTPQDTDAETARMNFRDSVLQSAQVRQNSESVQSRLQSAAFERDLARETAFRKAFEESQNAQPTTRKARKLKRLGNVAKVADAVHDAANAAADVIDEKTGKTGSKQRQKGTAQKRYLNYAEESFRRGYENRTIKQEREPFSRKPTKSALLDGSKTQAEYLDDLMKQISDSQYDFVTYSQEMDKWANPSALQIQIDRRTKGYYHNMIDMCIKPLEDGVSAGSIVETIGIYAGMCITSKAFRDYSKAAATKAMWPAVEKMTRTTDAFRDALPKAAQRMCDWTERTTGHKVPFVGERLEMHEFRSETTDERLKAKKEAMLKVLNKGRVPLTPETVALHYVSFSQQLYTSLRQADLDDEQKEDCIKNYDKSIKCLFKLAEVDGVDKDDAKTNIRSLVGSLSTLHPEFRSMFHETAGFSVSKGAGRETTFSDGKTGKVWNGEYYMTDSHGRQTSTQYKGAFRVRYPADAKSTVNTVQSYMTSLLSNVDDVRVVQKLGDSELADEVREHFQRMVRDDCQVPELKEGYDQIAFECAKVRFSVEESRSSAYQSQQEKDKLERARIKSIPDKKERGEAWAKYKEDKAQRSADRKRIIEEMAKEIPPEQAVWELGVYRASVAWFNNHPGAAVDMQMEDIVVNMEQADEGQMAARVSDGAELQNVVENTPPVSEEEIQAVAEAAETPEPEATEAYEATVDAPVVDMSASPDALREQFEEPKPKSKPKTYENQTHGLDIDEGDGQYPPEFDDFN